MCGQGSRTNKGLSHACRKKTLSACGNFLLSRRATVGYRGGMQQCKSYRPIIGTLWQKFDYAKIANTHNTPGCVCIYFNIENLAYKRRTSADVSMQSSRHTHRCFCLAESLTKIHAIHQSCTFFCFKRTNSRTIIQMNKNRPRAQKGRKLPAATTARTAERTKTIFQQEPVWKRKRECRRLCAGHLCEGGQLARVRTHEVLGTQSQRHSVKSGFLVEEAPEKSAMRILRLLTRGTMLSPDATYEAYCEDNGLDGKSGVFFGNREKMEKKMGWTGP